MGYSVEWHTVYRERRMGGEIHFHLMEELVASATLPVGPRLPLVDSHPHRVHEEAAPGGGAVTIKHTTSAATFDRTKNAT